MDWTDEQTEQVKTLFHQGYSMANIAAQIGGVTRNAVIGKLHRLGLWRVTRSKTPLPLAVSTAKRSRNGNRPGANLLGIQAKRRRAIEAPELKAEPIAPSELAGHAFGTPCTLIDRAPGRCEWPINDGGPYLFCNAVAAEGFHYCPDHCEISYTHSRGERPRYRFQLRKFTPQKTFPTIELNQAAVEEVVGRI